MRDQDLELIAALVEGRLDDETEARALIASSPEHRAEFEAQKLAYEALRGAGTESLTEPERTALHRDIWTELRSGGAPEPQRTPWYYRWTPVAAGLLLVVGLVAVLSQTWGGNDAGESANLAADMAVTTTAAESSDGGADTIEQGRDDGDTGALEEEQTESPTDDAADGEASGGAGTDETSGETETTSSETAIEVYEGEADLLRQGVFGSRLQSYDDTDSDIETCVEDSGLGNHQILATLSAPLEGAEAEDGRRLVVVYPEDAQIESAPLSFIALDTCEVVYTDEPDS